MNKELEKAILEFQLKTMIKPVVKRIDPIPLIKSLKTRAYMDAIRKELRT